ncbi:hypothetical protein D9756_006210 [Leucocoprinus leucothites]|uniref:Yeast cell wall synthesis Kre9/Knh1-like N-terminal domain-containing protein n=1 Tax=Leucocoprinus leucothites TaxID=201217 RepID=A0A8H5D2Z1_9AGAR|nr:hypothetical protein D9756_006210 [Leucoagaricus leucothites]
MEALSTGVELRANGNASRQQVSNVADPHFICTCLVLLVLFTFFYPLVKMMFKISILAALVAPLVSALTVDQPSQAVNNGGDMTFTWTAASGDPATFSVYLQNPTFNSVFGVANNVDASLGTLTIQVPAVPPNQQYTIILVPIDNVNNVLAQSAPFNIGDATASSSTPASTMASTTRTSVANSGTNTAPGTTLTPIGTTSSTSRFGNTVSGTSSNTNVASGASAAPSTSGSNSAALPVRFDMNLGVVASVVLSVFAGAAVIAL